MAWYVKVRGGQQEKGFDEMDVCRARDDRSRPAPRLLGFCTGPFKNRGTRNIPSSRSESSDFFSLGGETPNAFTLCSTAQSTDGAGGYPDVITRPPVLLENR